MEDLFFEKEGDLCLIQEFKTVFYNIVFSFLCVPDADVYLRCAGKIFQCACESTGFGVIAETDTLSAHGFTPWIFTT